MNVPCANFYLKDTKSKEPTLIYLQAKYSINNIPQRVMLSIGDKVLPNEWNGIKKRTIVSNAVDGWNFRDNHMLETINRILKLYGPTSKAIIWAHNNHVGDAQYATLIWEGKTNLGNMLRHQYGVNNVFIAGFGSYSGSIIAAEKWGAPYKKMLVAFADDSTWEQKLHQINTENKIIICKELKDKPNMLRWMSHMGIGVTYRPLDRTGIYSLSVIPNRYDAFLFFDHTNALHPIEAPVKGKEVLGKNALDY